MLFGVQDRKHPALHFLVRSKGTGNQRQGQSIATKLCGTFGWGRATVNWRVPKNQQYVWRIESDFEKLRSRVFSWIRCAVLQDNVAKFISCNLQNINNIAALNLFQTDLPGMSLAYGVKIDITTTCQIFP